MWGTGGGKLIFYHCLLLLNRIFFPSHPPLALPWTPHDLPSILYILRDDYKLSLRLFFFFFFFMILRTKCVALAANILYTTITICFVFLYIYYLRVSYSIPSHLSNKSSFISNRSFARYSSLRLFFQVIICIIIALTSLINISIKEHYHKLRNTTRARLTPLPDEGAAAAAAAAAAQELVTLQPANP